MIQDPELLLVRIRKILQGGHEEPEQLIMAEFRKDLTAARIEGFDDKMIMANMKDSGEASNAIIQDIVRNHLPRVIEGLLKGYVDENQMMVMVDHAMRARIMREVKHKPSPRFGAAAIIIKDKKIVLVERGKEPLKGKWVLPGGGVRFLEPLDVALRREVREETGLEIQIIQMECLKEIINPPDEHRVIQYFRAKVPFQSNSNPIPGGDAVRAGWFTVQDLIVMEEGLTPTTKAVIDSQNILQNDLR